MSAFDDFMTDSVTFVKKDGSVQKTKVLASVSAETISIFDVSLPIEVGDRLLRTRSNGLIDEYIVVDPGYSAGMPPHIPANYKVRFRRSDGPQPQLQNIVANFHGANSRMNLNSIDNSTNNLTFNENDLNRLEVEFAKLRIALLPLARRPEDYTAIGAIASAEIAAKEGNSPKVGAALAALGKASQWVLETASVIGVPLAVSALKSYLGLPPG